MLPVTLPFPRESASKLISNPDTFATVIHLIVLSAYGPELYGDEEQGMDPIDPVELYARIKEDFRAELPEEGENRLQALMLAISTDAFFEDVESFIAVSMALCEGDLGDLVNGTLEEITIPEMLWGAFEVLLNRDDCPEFEPSVAREIKKIIGSEGDDQGDAVEGSERNPSHQAYVEEQKSELIQQLTDLGLDPVMVSQFVKQTENENRKQEQGHGHKAQ